MKKNRFRPIIVAMALIACILLAGFVDSVLVFVKYASHLDAVSLRTGISSMLNIVGMLALLFPAFFLVKSLRDERTPFVAKNIKYLKIIVMILTVLGVLQLAADMLGSMPMMMIGSNGGVDAVVRHTAFSISSFLYLIFAFVVFCIASVFEYGIRLQQESDETL